MPPNKKHITYTQVNKPENLIYCTPTLPFSPFSPTDQQICDNCNHPPPLTDIDAVDAGGLLSHKFETCGRPPNIKETTSVILREKPGRIRAGKGKVSDTENL